MAILCAAILVSAWMIEESGRFFLAWYWSRSSEISRRIRGAELIPGNANAWRYLGLSLQYNLDESDIPESIAYYQRAGRSDPRSADDWLELGSAYEANCDVTAAQTAF